MTPDAQGFGHGLAHAKVILIGEHAVVYGQPAIAMPLSTLKVEAIVRPAASRQTIVSPPFTGDLAEVGDSFEGLRQLLLQLLRRFNQVDWAFELRVDTNIPEERGLGSSAAFATAITKAFFDYFEVHLTHAELQYFANLEENITHGKASGLDVAAVSANAPVWFIRDQILESFDMNMTPAALVIGDTGVHGQTIRAISVIQEQLVLAQNQTTQQIERLGELVADARHALSDHHLRALGEIFNQAQSVLSDLGVSHPQLDKLIATARQAGALGAKLTGGGIGGAMIALAKNRTDAQTIATALKNAGARDTWIADLNFEMD